MVSTMGKLGMDPGRSGTVNGERATSRGKLARRVIAACLTAIVVLGASAGCATLGLPGDRLMSCQSNDDCQKKDPKRPACANLRCVECAYDGDCESGFCTENTCKALFKSETDKGPDGAPQNLDACLSRCGDDQPCVNKCHEQFPQADPPK